MHSYQSVPELEHDTARLPSQEGDVEFLGRVDLFELFDNPRRQGPVEDSPTALRVRLM